jgi:hypothetical protein
MDMFFGGQFTKYGAQVVSITEESIEERDDPMNRVFPKVSSFKQNLNALFSSFVDRYRVPDYNRASSNGLLLGVVDFNTCAPSRALKTYTFFRNLKNRPMLFLLRQCFNTNPLLFLLPSFFPPGDQVHVPQLRSLWND